MFGWELMLIPEYGRDGRKWRNVVCEAKGAMGQWGTIPGECVRDGNNGGRFRVNMCVTGMSPGTWSVNLWG